MEELKKDKFHFIVLGAFIGIVISIVIGLTCFIINDRILSTNDDNVQTENNNDNSSNDSEEENDDNVQLDNNNDNSSNDSEEENNDNVQLDNNNDNSSNDSEEKNDDINFNEISANYLGDLLTKINVYDINFNRDYPIDNFNQYANNLSNNDKLYFLYSNIGDGFSNGFRKDNLNSVVSRYFNDDFNYIDGDVYCRLDHILYRYNDQNGKYTVATDHPGHGGSGYYQNLTYFINGYIENGEYIINTKILYGDYCGEICGPILKFYDNSNRDNLVYEDKDFGEGLSYDEIYKLVEDKLPITTYKFVRNNSYELVLSSVTVQ